MDYLSNADSAYVVGDCEPLELTYDWADRIGPIYDDDGDGFYELTWDPDDVSSGRCELTYLQSQNVWAQYGQLTESQGGPGLHCDYNQNNVYTCNIWVQFPDGDLVGDVVPP